MPLSVARGSLSPRAHLSPTAQLKLLEWFTQAARALPWRVCRDPYRIWVSEVMLQQTTVPTVAARFEAFLVRFPTVQHLAAAPESDVLKHWQGLGYYNRARNLHRTAQQIVNAHAGEFPTDPEVWAEFPGVGRYILGAVLSQAFETRLPIVEANTKRVLCRLFGQTGDPKTTAVQAWLWETAEAILPKQRVGDFNQALMELGALLCTPEKPACGQCPLQKNCVAKREQLQESIPLKSKAPPPVEVREVCLAIENAGCYLLVQRPANGRWANMWEFPSTPLQEGETDALALQRLLQEIHSKAIVSECFETVCYAVTRFRMSMNCYAAKSRTKGFRSAYYVQERWLLPSELAEVPLSSPQRRLAKLLQ